MELGFAEETSTLSAGTPYLFRWIDSQNAIIDIGNPFFKSRTINSGLNPVALTDNVSGKTFTFTGSYNYQTFENDNTSILFLGEGNTLYYPKQGAEIGACRAYFVLPNGITAGEPEKSGIKAFVLNFEDDVTSISTISNELEPATGWYTLDGLKLDAAPAVKGMYIHDGKKVMIK